MLNKRSIIVLSVLLSVVFAHGSCFAFWVWSPKDKTMVNPKYAVKDTPREQYDWAMRFFEQGDFKRAAEEFNRLTSAYPDSRLAPDAQYYAGRSYEELGKYYFAYQNYQKTLENYPYTERSEEIIRREFNIAGIFQTEEEPKLMELELSLSLERAIEIYKKIVENNAFGPYADKAIFQMADCYRRSQKYKESMKAYEKLIKDYPESDLVDDAKYQLAYTRYEASLSPEYDQGSTEEALAAFKKLSMTTSVPKVAEEADLVLRELKEKKALSLYNIGIFYEKRKKPHSAVIYYKEVMGKYPGTDGAQKSRIRLEKIENKEKEK